MVDESSSDPADRSIPVVVHLSGKLRGTSHRLYGDTLRIGTSSDAEIHFPAVHEPTVAEHHAVLERSDGSYTLRVEDGQRVWVNGERSTSAELDSGDVLEIGPSGPILRFRLYPRGSDAHKSMGEVFSDCMDCARNGAAGPIGRAGIFLQELPRELAVETSPKARSGAAILLVGLIVLVAIALQSTEQLDDRLEQQSAQVEGIADVVAMTRETALKPEDLSDILQAVDDASERLSTLEKRAVATQRVISAASRSVIFLQGAYGFDAPDGSPLRYQVGSDGRPVVDAQGNPAIVAGGEGPPLEAFYTGTGFVATEEGLLLTNRHVAEPWQFERAAQHMVRHGFRPVMRRFVGYLPDRPEPFDVELVVSSDHADLAVLKCSDVTRRAPVLELREEPLEAGDPVLVMGFPTGIQAVLARADAAFVESLAKEGELDFWTVARRLAAAGHITPLATRGIVGQLTSAYVVYDAETTSGGSGGPVLDLEGRVVAINAAILPQFGGSNLGVPAAEARRLLEAAEKLADGSPLQSTPGPELDPADPSQGLDRR